MNGSLLSSPIQGKTTRSITKCRAEHMTRSESPQSTCHPPCRAALCSSPLPPNPPNRIPAYRKLIGGCSGYPAVTLISAWPLVFGGGPDTLCCSAQLLAMRRLLYLSEHSRLSCSKMGSGRAADLREVTDTPQCLLLPSSMIFTKKCSLCRTRIFAGLYCRKVVSI